MEDIIELSVKEMPTHWYNILPDLPEPLPPPKGGEQAIKAMIPSCLKQEVLKERWIEIPEDLQKLYQKIGRPRPLYRAKKLEKFLGTPAELYYKSEFFSPTGSHKLNTALAQTFFAKKDGFARLVTETGAGQWGTALAYASRLMGLKSTVYWVRAVYNWKLERRKFLKACGAEIFASPSNNTKTGRKLYKENPDHPGSLGIAISEGLEDAIKDKKAAYSLGSVLNHVLLHQTIIGLETKKQLEKIGRLPDIVISCLGGGSNFGGIALPFMYDVLREGKKIKFIAAQSQAAPNLKGEYRYNFADHEGIAPQLKMLTLGHQKKMPPIKGDGLRYHGCSPIISLLRVKGYIDSIDYPVDEKYVFERAKIFFETEGPLPPPVIIPEVGVTMDTLSNYKPEERGWPAPESAYSVACAIDQAIECKKSGQRKVILFNISGHGFLDIEAYKEILGL